MKRNRTEFAKIRLSLGCALDTADSGLRRAVVHEYCGAGFAAFRAAI
jgi:hypothetical protein